MTEDEAKTLAEALMAVLPRHDAGLEIEHNSHKENYETVRDAFGPRPGRSEPQWVSERDRELAFETDEVWEAFWYPRTPVGSCYVAAHTLEALLLWLSREDDDDAS